MNQDIIAIYAAVLIIGFYAFYVIFIIIMTVFYYYTLYRLAKQMKHDRPWFAFIPVLNSILVFQLADLNYMLGLVSPLLFIVSMISFIYVSVSINVNLVIAILGLISMIGCFLWFIVSKIWPIYRIAKKNNKDPTMMLFISLTPYTMLFTYFLLWPSHNLMAKTVKVQSSKASDTNSASVKVNRKSAQKNVIDKVLS